MAAGFRACEQAEAESVNLTLSGEIWVNDFTEKSAVAFREQILKHADKDGSNVIPIYIDSYGGQVDALAKMLETMDEVPNRFITVCMGKAMSCGAILLSHGDLRFCGQYSRVMVHNVSTMAWGDVFALKATAEEADRLNKMFLGLLAKNCNMTYDKLQELIKASTDSKDLYLSASDAVKFGIADRVGLPELMPIVQWACETVPKKHRLAMNELVNSTTPPAKTKTVPAVKKKKKKQQKKK